MTSATSRSIPPNGTGVALGPIQSARAAGLRYVTDTGPGIRRRRAGKHFSYLGPDDRPIRDSVQLRRIKALGIPPAWTDVWICPIEHGHLQATGRDAKGRKQYRYHCRWREVRDQTKYDRVTGFAEALPQIRARVEQDLALAGMPREKVLATVVRLLETTMIRVGNEEYVRQNRSFGLTTMRNRHVEVQGATLRFQFRGKSGKKHAVEVHDRRLARIVKRCREIPGHHLFEYLDAGGQSHTIDSGDVNEYLREITGQEFTAKDFRTWAGTLLALRALRECGACDTDGQRKTNIVQAIDCVRERLGNTRAVCRKYYVHPAIIAAYMEGTLPEPGAVEDPVEPGNGLSGEERAVLAFLGEQSSTRTGSPAQSGQRTDDHPAHSVESKVRRGSPEVVPHRRRSVRIPQVGSLIPVQ